MFKKKKDDLETQFDDNGKCKMCNDTGIIETRGMTFKCNCEKNCEKKRDKLFDNTIDEMKRYTREIIDGIIQEEFGMTADDIAEMKADIATQKKAKREAKKRHDELKKNMIMLPIEGAKKSLVYDEKAFEPNSGYSIFIYNNNVTKLEDVVRVLKEKCDVNEQQAIKIAHFVNDKGAAIIKITSDVEEAQDICRAFAAYGIQSEYIKH